MTTQKRTTRGSRTKTNGPKSRATASTPVLDDESRNDIIGIALSATAIALAVALMTQGTGIAGKFVADGLRLGFGAGAYVLPVLLLLWGVSFFVRAFAIAEQRVGAGLGLLLLALISMLAISSAPDSFWDQATIQAHGGYLGGAVAWALTGLVGPAISYVILGALLLIGLVITGLSISGVVEWVTASFSPNDARESRGGQPHSRRSRTVPLHDIDENALSDIARAEPVAGRRSQKPIDDPERRKKTLPSAPAGAPRAMEGFDLPPISLLTRTSETMTLHRASDRELRTTATLIEDTLATLDRKSVV